MLTGSGRRPELCPLGKASQMGAQAGLARVSNDFCHKERGELFSKPLIHQGAGSLTSRELRPSGLARYMIFFDDLRFFTMRASTCLTEPGRRPSMMTFTNSAQTRTRIASTTMSNLSMDLS